MAFPFLSRARRAWNAFLSREPTPSVDYGPSYFYRQDRSRTTRGNERSIINSIFNRIAIDAASVDIKHVRMDDSGRYLSDIDSGLNTCLTLEANVDQTGRSFRQDIFMSMLDEGYVAVVPIDTDSNPEDGSFDIETMRVGKIVEWYPRHVKVNVYNELTGRKQDLTVEKRTTAILENPLYATINEPNSTLQRLIRKLRILDAIDEQSGSGKLDLIIQLPYVVKSEQRRAQAEKRRSDIENQLNGSKYGIAYTDGTEKITQLNRPVENNLMAQIEYLTTMLYGQLGITQEVMNGSADEKTMLNYINRTIEPMISMVVDEFKRKFLSKTARTQKQSIMSFRDPFKLVPVSEIANIADTFTRNEIATSNEMRQAIGWKPSSDPRADELRNKNLSAPAKQNANPNDDAGKNEAKEEIQNGDE